MRLCATVRKQAGSARSPGAWKTSRQPRGNPSAAAVCFMAGPSQAVSRRTTWTAGCR
jgi:hypothetical protein